jgi:16S rRNA (cytidine1402-2'-O)-methyltransferase
VSRAIEIGSPVVPIPGAAAFVSAAVASGLATDALYFGGFLPSKKGERRKRLEEVHDIPATLVFYEAPHRLARSLADCYEILGDRRAAIGRELTKIHEEIVSGTLSALAADYSKTAVKGEIVLVIDRLDRETQPHPGPPIDLPSRIAELENKGLESKAALKKAAKEFGLSKSEAYRIVKIKK